MIAGAARARVALRLGRAEPAIVFRGNAVPVAELSADGAIAAEVTITLTFIRLRARCLITKQHHSSHQQIHKSWTVHD